MHNHHFDSIWNDLRFRDDIVISTYAKSGTTWTQQIVWQLVFGPDPELEVAQMSPWLDLRVPPKEVKLPMVEAQRHRRFLKAHLPLDALVFSPRAKYLYIVMFVHFADLEGDMPGQMRRIAAFLGTDVADAGWNRIGGYCSFDWMKRHATKSVPLGGSVWDGGAQAFINKGTNGRWTDTLTPEDVREYEERAVRQLGVDGARWLAEGGPV
jgi:hypothetical protein